MKEPSYGGPRSAGYKPNGLVIPYEAQFTCMEEARQSAVEVAQKEDAPQKARIEGPKGITGKD